MEKLIKHALQILLLYKMVFAYYGAHIFKTLNEIDN